MAKALRILGANVTHQLSSGYTVVQKMPAAEERVLAGSISSPVMTMKARMECPTSQKGSGFIGVEVYDANDLDTPLAEKSSKGRLGQANQAASANLEFMSIVLLMPSGAQETPGHIVDTEVDEYGEKSCRLILDPGLTTAGKIKVMYSGKLPNTNALVLDATTRGIFDSQFTVGQVFGAPGLSGHAEIEIDFEVVDL